MSEPLPVGVRDLNEPPPGLDIPEVVPEGDSSPPPLPEIEEIKVDL